MLKKKIVGNSSIEVRIDAFTNEGGEVWKKFLSCYFTMVTIDTITKKPVSLLICSLFYNFLLDKSQQTGIAYGRRQRKF